MTDTRVIDEASRLKMEHYSGTLGTVHIWTKDATPQSHEPDAEMDPFLREQSCALEAR
jgi:hypothetical protein